ncbi:hypothetical protein [Sphingopyxis fribergensis]
MAADATPLTTAELKEAVRKIVLAQGNDFIKELLRQHKIKIGATKSDFLQNLLDAIEKGEFTQPMLETWLGEIEGWGNQHIYLFKPPAQTKTDIGKLLMESDFNHLVGQSISYAFPTDLELCVIDLSPDHLSMGWHRSNSGWERAKAKDRQRQEGADLYEYRAYRQRFDRSVVRFEWRFSDPYAAMMIQLPNEGDQHDEAMKRVWADLVAANLTPAPLERHRLTAAFKSLSRESKGAIVQSVKLVTDGAYIDLVSTSAKGAGIGDVEAVRQVRRGADDTAFADTDAMLEYRPTEYETLSRNIKIHGYGMQSRIRIWVQCKKEDVYFVIADVWAHNKED